MARRTHSVEVERNESPNQRAWISYVHYSIWRNSNRRNVFVTDSFAFWSHGVSHPLENPKWMAKANICSSLDGSMYFAIYAFFTETSRVDYRNSIEERIPILFLHKVPLVALSIHQLYFHTFIKWKYFKAIDTRTHNSSCVQGSLFHKLLNQKILSFRDGEEIETAL